MNRRWMLTAASFVFAALVANPAHAGCAAGASAEKKTEGGMDPAMMEAWMKTMTPGPQHKHLEFYVGDWTTANTMWMDGTESKSTGTMHSEAVLGGRYFISKHIGNFNGMPFEGMGIDGYDNMNGEFFSVWLDNMGTGFMLSKGTSSDDMKSCTMTGSTKDPMTGQMVSHKMVSTITGPDTFKFEMWMTPAGGKEERMMEILYTRANKKS